MKTESKSITFNTDNVDTSSNIMWRGLIQSLRCHPGYSERDPAISHEYFINDTKETIHRNMLQHLLSLPAKWLAPDDEHDEWSFHRFATATRTGFTFRAPLTADLLRARQSARVHRLTTARKATRPAYHSAAFELVKRTRPPRDHLAARSKTTSPLHFPCLMGTFPLNRAFGLGHSCGRTAAPTQQPNVFFTVEDGLRWTVPFKSERLC